MNTSGPIGFIYNILERIMRFFFVNLLWLIFSFPFVFFVTTLVVAQNTDQFIGISILLVTLAPLFLFPATAAMFAVVRKWIMKDTDIPIIKYYWKTYKENYVKSLLGGLVIGILWVIFIFDYYYFTININELFSYLFLLIFPLLFMFTTHFFSTIVHLEARFFYALKNALLLTLGRPIFSLGIGIINAFIIYISFFHFPSVLIPFFMGTLIAFVSFTGYYKIYLKVEESREENADNSFK